MKTLTILDRENFVIDSGVVGHSHWNQQIWQTIKARFYVEWNHAQHRTMTQIWAAIAQQIDFLHQHYVRKPHP
jgi:hypothetical protein